LPGTVAGDLDELYGEVVNMVVDGGVLQDTYSTVLKVDDNRVEVVRQGLGKVDFL
jgi:tRNA A37 threonylcarbamoyladenosine synthetase subunit TsaC/SUA5/YrdC